MNETIAALMHPGVQTVGMDDSIATVESFLTEQGRTWAPVTDDLGVVIARSARATCCCFTPSGAMRRRCAPGGGSVAVTAYGSKHDAVAPA